LQQSIKDKLQTLTLSDAALAVLDYPDGLENWGPLSARDWMKIQKFSQEEGHQLEKYKSNNNDVTYGNIKSPTQTQLMIFKGQYFNALATSLLKPLPFFVYQDNLKLAFQEDKPEDTNNNSVHESRTALELYATDFKERNNLQSKLKSDYLILKDIKSSPIPTTTLPSIDVISAHSLLLKRQIKDVVEMLLTSKKISKPLAKLLVKFSEEQQISPAMIEHFESSPSAVSFLTEETDVLTVTDMAGDYKIT